MQAAGKILTQVPEEPWATVCADFVGALPRSKHGNQMLVIIDRFSKWYLSMDNLQKVARRRPSQSDYAKVAKQVREWSFRFDGAVKSFEFLDQVERLATRTTWI